MNKIGLIVNIIFRHYFLTFFVLIIIMILSSILELSALILFAFQISAIGNIDNVSDGSSFSFLSYFVESNSYQTIFLIFLLIIILALIFRVLTVIFINSFSQNCRALISKDEFDFFGQQSLDKLKSKDLSSYASDILSEVDIFIQSGLLPTLKLFNSIILIIILISGIVFIGGKEVIIGYLIYFVIYVTLYMLSNKYVLKFGQIRKHKNQERYLVTTDAFRNYKYLKFENLMNEFSKKLLSIAKQMGKAQALTNSVADFPRIFLESVTFLLILIIFYLNQTLNVQDGIYFETIFLFGASALRFLPSMQLIYASTTAIRSISPTIDSINQRKTQSESKIYEKLKQLPEKITINNLNFSYKNNIVFNNFSTSINLNKFTLLKGSSGSGKSTLIDLILAFQQSNNSSIAWGDTYIKNPNQLADIVSYIPQDPTIFDGSVKKNLILNNDYNKDKINSIFNIIGLDTFITFEDLISDSYRIDILSGGQKQRIGIARALYSEPKYLILDESMSGLDIKSAEKIYNNLKKIDTIKGMLVISHNKELDHIFDEIIYISP